MNNHKRHGFLSVGSAELLNRTDAGARLIGGVKHAGDGAICGLFPVPFLVVNLIRQNVLS